MKILHVHMVTPAVYKAYTCTSMFYLHLLLPRQHQRTERKKKEVENERRENKCRHFVWPMPKQKIKQFLHHIYILPSAHPPYTQYMQHCPAGAFVHPNNPDETLKKQKKKKDCTISFLHQLMAALQYVSCLDSWFMSNSHQSCRKMLA